MRYGVLILVCGLGGLAMHSAAQSLTPAGNNWTRSDGDPGATRYSTLTQINTSNVKSLTRAWTFHTNSGRFAGAPSATRCAAASGQPFMRHERTGSSMRAP